MRAYTPFVRRAPRADQRAKPQVAVMVPSTAHRDLLTALCPFNPETVQRHGDPPCLLRCSLRTIISSRRYRCKDREATPTSALTADDDALSSIRSLLAMLVLPNGRRCTIRVEGVPDVTEARKGSIILVVRNDFGVAGRQRTCLSGSASALTRTAVSDLCSSSKSLLSLVDFTHEGG